MHLDLLVIGPHPDDAELSCGGVLALAAQRGQAAGILDLTRGELASNGTAAIRDAEAAEAARLLGVHRENLGLPDASLADEPGAAAALVAVLRRLRPTLLLAPWTADRHPDHGAAGQLGARAAFLAGLVNYRPELGPPVRPRLLHYPQRQEVRPDLVVDVSAAYHEKRRAIAAHRSQVGPGRDTLLNRPLGAEAWEIRDRYWGASIGVRHGEPYLLGAPVPVGDLVAHFAAHPAEPVLSPAR